MNVINTKIPIVSKNRDLFHSLTFDGKKYYLMKNGANEISVLDKTYMEIETIALKIPYNNIIYNQNKNIFYLQTEVTNNRIISVDRNFKKINESILLGIYQEKITSIGYCETDNILYIVSKSDIRAIERGKKNGISLIKNIKNKNIIKLNETTNMVQEEITMYTAANNINGDMYIAYKRNNENYIAKINDKEIVEEYYIDTECYIHNIIECDGKIQLFVTKEYNYIYETNIIIKEKREVNIKESCNTKKGCNCFEDCEYTKCNRENCLECSISKMIESIALEKVGISRILNTEGEKLQKIIEEEDSVCEILKANESINRTIVNITMLEQILYSKLELMTTYQPQKNHKNCERKE